MQREKEKTGLIKFRRRAQANAFLLASLAKGRRKRNAVGKFWKFAVCLVIITLGFVTDSTVFIPSKVFILLFEDLFHAPSYCNLSNQLNVSSNILSFLNVNLRSDFLISSTSTLYQDVQYLIKW